MTRSPVRNLYYHLPEGFRNAILVKRRERIWKQAGIVFIHIPKAAGTSFNLALYGQFMGHARASDIDRWGSRGLKALPRFAIARNPWDRLVSAYRFARRGVGIGGAYQAGMRNPEQYRVDAFETFESFVKDWLAPRDIRTLDGVFQPQWRFIANESGTVLVDHLGCIENLDPTYDFLLDKLGHVPTFEEANRSGDRVDYRSFYTDELAELVAGIYTEDVANLGYSYDAC